MTDKTPQILVDLYKNLSELTRPKCDQCRAPRSCCSSEYCEMAAEFASACGVSIERTNHPRLSFMGQNGCVVPPHLRPLCTRHVCSINSFGCDPNDSAFTDNYFKLVDEIMEVEDGIPRV